MPTTASSTRGLDASTALEFVQALRIATDIMNQSTLVSIYQAGESLYRLFDKVCVIYEGRMAYFGPADQARQYFIDMGYEPANRQTTADFLVAVTDPNGRIVREGFEHRAPRTAAEFADYYTRSQIAQENRADMDSYLEEHVDNDDKRKVYNKSVSQAHAQYTRGTSPYITSVPMQVKALMIRRVQILKGGFLAPLIQMVYVVPSIFQLLEDSPIRYTERSSFRPLLLVLSSSGSRTRPLHSSLAVVFSSCKCPECVPEQFIAKLSSIAAPSCSLLFRPWRKSQRCSLNGQSSSVNHEPPCIIRSSTPWLSHS